MNEVLCHHHLSGIYDTRLLKGYLVAFVERLYILNNCTKNIHKLKAAQLFRGTIVEYFADLHHINELQDCSFWSPGYELLNVLPGSVVMSRAVLEMFYFYGVTVSFVKNKNLDTFLDRVMVI